MVANSLENHLTNEFTPGIFGSLCESMRTHLPETRPSVCCHVTDAGRICSRRRTSVSVSSLCPQLMSYGCSMVALQQWGSCLLGCDSVSKQEMPHILEDSNAFTFRVKQFLTAWPTWGRHCDVWNIENCLFSDIVSHPRRLCTLQQHCCKTSRCHREIIIYQWDMISVTACC